MFSWATVQNVQAGEVSAHPGNVTGSCEEEEGELFSGHKYEGNEM